ncbi:2-C-methyl-D-erythritol 4-phosphate cytidylyltransferase [Paenibacillus sp. MWE-103]|uniref:2-C-methyl-D-erythritol 4-phosphate cytidylyltransferase n=1 Tax=Paenibacillus artemisiicola TaxID=1172618 RepID=A0ABS3W4S4_9BACL|nr:2-C-methyl-D-erythritol 4-phosphate cytidylyltransferase [Paenibacillus artemisiicola]
MPSGQAGGRQAGRCGDQAVDDRVAQPEAAGRRHVLLHVFPGARAAVQQPARTRFLRRVLVVRLSDDVALPRSVPAAAERTVEGGDGRARSAVAALHALRDRGRHVRRLHDGARPQPAVPAGAGVLFRGTLSPFSAAALRKGEGVR